MPNIRVQVPGHGIVEFPEGTSQEEMAQALDKLGSSVQFGEGPSAASMMGVGAGAPSSRVSDTPSEPSLGEKLAGNSTLQSMAHPQSTGDMLSLMVPSSESLARMGPETVKDAAKGVYRIFKGATDIIRHPIQTIEKAPVVLEDLYNRAFNPHAEPLTRKMNDLPLHQQMDYLPQQQAPFGRVATPPPPAEGASFNDLPLHRQMEQLPTQAPTPVRGGTPEPPIQNLGHETAPAPSAAAPPVNELQQILDGYKARANQIAPVVRKPNLPALTSEPALPDRTLNPPYEESLQAAHDQLPPLRPFDDVMGEMDAGLAGLKGTVSDNQAMIDKIDRQLSGQLPSERTGKFGPQVAVEDIPASKSKRTPMSATKGLSEKDVAGVGLNPRMKVLTIAEQLKELMMKQRMQRRGLYRSEGQADALLRNKDLK